VTANSNKSEEQQERQNTFRTKKLKKRPQTSYPNKRSLLRRSNYTTNSSAEKIKFTFGGGLEFDSVDSKRKMSKKGLLQTA
jgi:hypothetical protein